MRKVVFALFAFAGLLLGCTSVDCSMNNSVAGVYAFLPDRNDSLGNWNDSSLTVVVKGIEGEDTIMNKKAISSNFSLLIFLQNLFYLPNITPVDSIVFVIVF